MPSKSLSLSLAPATVDAECYCLNAQRAARRLARVYDDGLRPLGISHGQFSMLMLVAGLQPVGIGRLAEEMVMDRTTVTAAVKLLAKRALLRSHVAADDARQRLLTLTAAGQALLEQAASEWRRLQDIVESHRPRRALRADFRRMAGVAAMPPAPPSRPSALRRKLP